MLFNRNEVKVENSVHSFTQADIKDTPGLWNAPLEIAINFGGKITQEALSSMNLTYEYKHIIVDVKTHLLQPGMFPAIPGWHTDGVPRGGSMSPAKGSPDINMQENARAPKYHLMVLGIDCPTIFIKNRNVEVELLDTNLSSLYKSLTQKVKADINLYDTYEIEPGFIYEWDWWELHTAQAARQSGWRYLIRVTETDYFEPQTDLNQIFRRQQQVFLPSTEFGW
ncbi:phage protein [Yersinia phage phiR1-RT]|uniref:Phage protein n=1 Tax=Yersinia phage phiR1-RT TaxID=1206558 RepID=I7LEK4_BPPR1|nr:phage protein [Yersinia phage phiR1-RT]CCI88662.1 phage protein [Yersinia phage phiR1-RT]